MGQGQHTTALMKKWLFVLVCLCAAVVFGFAFRSSGQGFVNPPQPSIAYGASVQLTSQYTNSTTTFTNVAGGNTLQFAVAANATYTGTCHLYYQAATSGGLQIEFTGPSSPNNVIYSIVLPFGVSGNVVSFTNGVSTSYGNALGTTVSTAAHNWDATVSFALQNGANSGTVNLLAASVTSSQLQIQPGSYCTWQQQFAWPQQF